MTQITARNVNSAMVDALWRMKVTGVDTTTRHGPAKCIPEPVIITYNHPKEMVMWWDKRDANPFFHLMEAIWMMAGRDDVAYVAQFNKRMHEFAEPDGRIHGAYGARWYDQLPELVDVLQKDPNSRQAVLQMWDWDRDLNVSYKDRPCNTHAYFQIVNSELNMTVCNRSNDLVWGAFGSNAVHFAFLQWVLANVLEVGVGKYRQITNNLHLYEQHWPLMTDLPTVAGFDKYYSIKPWAGQLVDGRITDFQIECNDFCERRYARLDNRFLQEVAKPMQEYYLHRKDEDNRAIGWIGGMPDVDWKFAAINWIARRNNHASE